eukprot:SAG31_NODE_17747_length_659_cov_1.080357_1_plen_41_part_01
MPMGQLYCTVRSTSSGPGTSNFNVCNTFTTAYIRYIFAVAG